MKDLKAYLQGQESAIIKLKEINDIVGGRRSKNGYAKGANIFPDEISLIKYFVSFYRLPCLLRGEGSFEQFVFSVFKPPVFFGEDISEGVILKFSSRDMDLGWGEPVIRAFLGFYAIAGSKAFKETARVVGIRESQTVYEVFDRSHATIDAVRKKG